MKKILAFALVLLMIMPLLVFSASADTIAPDTSWYDANQSEFTITTAAQLYGFASLSQSGNTFAGKRVKLGADITVNEGNAAEWASKAPGYFWSPIKDFAGTFDGQGHTISGIYQSEDEAALFHYASEGALITDFKLINSYFSSSNVAAGILGQASGCTVSKIYCDAIIRLSGHHGGGIVGVCYASPEKITVENCWFNGSVTIDARYAAGIVGNGNGATVAISHCLNTGSVYSTQNAAGNSHIGGMIGRNDAITLVDDCLNIGKISSAWLEGGNRDELGSLVGACTDNIQGADGVWTSGVSITRSWASAESCAVAVGANASKDPSQQEDYGVIPQALLKGYGGYANTNLDFKNSWAVDPEGTPIPQCFAENIPALYDVNIPQITAAEVKAEGHYGPRWTLTLEVPEGVSKDAIKVGALIVPDKAIPAGYDLTLSDASLTYRDQEYEVANVEGKILRESDENTIVATFVVTDLSAANARVKFTAVPYAVYQMDGGELEVYGAGESMVFYKQAVLSLEDDGVDAVTKAYTEQVLAPIDAEMGGRFPVAPQWSERDLFEDVPAMIAEDTVIIPEEDKGMNNYVMTVDSTLDNDYFAYLEVLEAFGFERVYDNAKEELAANADAIYTAIYQKGDLMVVVTDFGYANKCYVSAIWDMQLSEHLYDNYKDTAIAGNKTTMAMMELYYYGTGICIQMKNGHFLVFDGGLPGDLDNLLKYMESLVPAGQKPVVEGWFISHYHADHSHLLSDFVANPSWCDRLYVDGFYGSLPSDAVCAMDPGVFNEIPLQLTAMSMLKTTGGDTPFHYRPHSGETYYFCDISIDIMLTQEQLPYASYTSVFNDSSTWFRINIDGQNVLFAGDSHQSNMELIMNMFEREYLEFDFFYALHHGENTWDPFTDWVKLHTVLWPDRVVYTTAPNNHLREIAEEYVNSYAEGTVVFTFPYVHGSNSYTRLPGRDAVPAP